MQEIWEDIQGILALSDIHPADCIKINNLIIDLLKECEELKKQLHEASLTIQEMTERDIECPSNCEKLRILEKQLETYEIKGYEQNEELNKMSFDIRKNKTQQKEFIKYLEEEIKIYSKTTYAEEILKELEEILQKYKSIIGENNE